MQAAVRSIVYIELHAFECDLNNITLVDQSLFELILPCIWTRFKFAQSTV